MIKKNTKQHTKTTRTTVKHTAKTGKQVKKASELPESDKYGKAPSTNGRGH